MAKRTGKDVTAPTVDEIAEQRAQDLRILELALSGNNGVEIAAEVGVHTSTVYRTLDRIWARNEQPRADQLRGKWDARIEAAVKGLWPKVLDGDVASVNAFVRLAERAAKLHGLDQQVRRDAGALAEALLGDPEKRAARATEIRDRVTALRSVPDPDAGSETG